MGNALRDQLLKSGLVTDKQVKKAAKDKQKEDRQKHGQKQTGPDAATLEAQRIAAEKAEKIQRDRELNLQRKEEQERKSLAAQLKQLIEAHRQGRGDGEIAYSFADGGKVKRIHIGADVRDRLAAGRLVIVRSEAGYDVVLPEIAQRIRERDPQSIALWNSASSTETDADDPYADYQVPDDLMW
jgi:uncharacterized protein YaiL (DUF2058 family)